MNQQIFNRFVSVSSSNVNIFKFALQTDDDS